MSLHIGDGAAGPAAAAWLPSQHDDAAPGSRCSPKKALGKGLDESTSLGARRRSTHLIVTQLKTLQSVAVQKLCVLVSAAKASGSGPLGASAGC